MPQSPSITFRVTRPSDEVSLGVASTVVLGGVSSPFSLFSSFEVSSAVADSSTLLPVEDGRGMTIEVWVMAVVVSSPARVPASRVRPDEMGLVRA